MLIIPPSYALPSPAVFTRDNPSHDSATEKTLGWTGGPNGRGTIDILWSSFATLLICSWTVLNNDMEHEERFWVNVAIKLTHWALAICAPEGTAGTAYADWTSAKFSIPLMHDLHVKQWTIVHGFYADMGGMAIEFADGETEYINSRQAAEYIEKGLLKPEDFTITEADISDRSKADSFTKGIATLQAGTFLAQCIGRIVQKLPISLLEIAVCGYVICAIFTYWFWLKKPKDVNHVTVIARGVIMTREFRDAQTPITKAAPVKDSIHFALAFSLAGLLFSAVHVAAWDYHFPSFVECVLWRAFSLLAPILMILAITTDEGVMLDVFSSNLSLYLGMSYGICRLYLIVASFTSMRSMPAKMYDTVDWSKYVPWFG